MAYFESFLQTSVYANTIVFANAISDLIETLQTEVRNNHGAFQIKKLNWNLTTFKPLKLATEKVTLIFYLKDKLLYKFPVAIWKWKQTSCFYIFQWTVYFYNYECKYTIVEFEVA